MPGKKELYIKVFEADEQLSTPFVRVGDREIDLFDLFLSDEVPADLESLVQFALDGIPDLTVNGSENKLSFDIDPDFGGQMLIDGLFNQEYELGDMVLGEDQKLKSVITLYENPSGVSSSVTFYEQPFAQGRGVCVSLRGDYK